MKTTRREDAASRLRAASQPVYYRTPVQQNQAEPHAPTTPKEA